LVSLQKRRKTGMGFGFWKSRPNQENATRGGLEKDLYLTAQKNLVCPKIFGNPFLLYFLGRCGIFCAKKKNVFFVFLRLDATRVPAGVCRVASSRIESHRVDPKNPKNPEKTRKNPKKPAMLTIKVSGKFRVNG
jgi:hypothetical protein